MVEKIADRKKLIKALKKDKYVEGYGLEAIIRMFNEVAERFDVTEGKDGFVYMEEVK